MKLILRLSLIAFLAGCVLVMSGCIFEYAAQKRYEKVVAENRAEEAALETRQIAIDRELNIAQVDYEAKSAELGAQIRLSRAQHTAEEASAKADIEAARSMDNLALVGLGLVGAGVPGLAGTLAGFRKARKDWQDGKEVGVEQLMDYIQTARAQDPTLDRYFADDENKGVQVLKALMDNDEDVKNVFDAVKRRVA